MATGKKNLVLAAMIFAVGMTFIDQTIVSIAIPEIQRDLHLSSTGVQWVINAYLLALAVTFAFGGRISDILGHRKMVVVGVVIFTVASALNGAVPDGSIAEPWFIVFRAVQGVGAGILLPAALAIVVSSYELRERGRSQRSAARHAHARRADESDTWRFSGLPLVPVRASSARNASTNQARRPFATGPVDWRSSLTDPPLGGGLLVAGSWWRARRLLPGCPGPI